MERFSGSIILEEEEEEGTHRVLSTTVPTLNDDCQDNNYILDVEDAFQIQKQPYAFVDQLSRQNSHAFPRGRSHLRAYLTDSKSTLIEEPAGSKLEDGFRAVARGAEAEDAKRYKEALAYFMDGGEILCAAAQNETITKIQDLVLHKSHEVLSWAERLADWLETDMDVSELPRRKAATVGLLPCGDYLDEFGRDVLRYTPVISKNPATFTEDGYQLQCIQERRNPSLLIVITMYNEDEIELSSTLRKCGNNIQYLADRNLPGYEGEGAWKNVLICIISDGRKNANPRTLNFLYSIGVFDECAMNIASTGVDFQLHLFERIVHLHKRLAKKEDVKFPPLQLVFALKEHNSGKLNSHLWYFNAFCAQINPEYTGLLDVGTMPTKSAFYRLLWNMEINPQIGGVCGEIAVDQPIPNLCNFVIAAQHYEYKVSNLLDKAMESCFGYISVLPGAFSAYRYEAIKGAPLSAYFKSLTTPMSELGPFHGNMYLAEDRILAFEVLAKKGCNWTMNYVKDAIARTDVPTNLTSLIAQRRRWLNGSFFAMIFAITKWHRVYTESHHTWIRKLFFTVQYMFMVSQTVLNWFLPGAFFLAIYYVVIAGFADDQWGFVNLSTVSKEYKDLFSIIFCTAYGIIFYIQIIYGMGNKPKHFKLTYTICAVVLGILMMIALVIVVLIFVLADQYSKFQIFFATAILGVYFIGATIHCELHHICMAFFQYVALLPTFVNVLMVYSFCNLQDLSWGTKGIDENLHAESSLKYGSENKGTYEDVVARQKALTEKQKKEAKAAENLKRRFDSFRSNLLIAWTLTNTFLVATCIYAVPASEFLPVLYVVVGSFNIFRLLGSVCYLAYLGRQWIIFQYSLRNGKLDKLHQSKRQTVAASDEMHSPQSNYTKLNLYGLRINPK